MKKKTSCPSNVFTVSHFCFLRDYFVQHKEVVLCTISIHLVKSKLGSVYQVASFMLEKNSV